MADQTPPDPCRGARRPGVQDAALGAVLLTVSLLVNGPPERLGPPPSHRPLSADGDLLLWWAGMVLTAVAVALRRRRPVPMLVLCTLSLLGRVADGLPPTIMDLGLLVALYTVAVHCRPATALAALGGLMLLTVGWTGYFTLAGQRVPGLPALGFRVQRGPMPAGSAGEGATAGPGIRPNPWTGVLVIGSGLVASWAVGSAGRSRRAYLDQLEARAHDLECDRDRRAALAVAAERARISREIHDVVAHGLSVIVIQAQGGAAALDHHPDDTRAALETIVRTGRDSLGDMRRALDAIGEVDDAWHPQRGLADLDLLLTQVRQAGTPVELLIEGTAARAPTAVDLSIYRIIQEALTNTMKHAGPGTRVRVLLSYCESEVRLEISDDGSGGHGLSGNGLSGNGLRGMHERARLLGGRLEAGPSAHGGFTVRATLPIHAPVHPDRPDGPDGPDGDR